MSERRKRMKKEGGMVAVLMLCALALAGSPAQAQQTGQECVLNCGEEPFACQSNFHWAKWADPLQPTHMYGSGAHVEPDCWPGLCEIQHPDCLGGGGPDPDGGPVASLSELLDDLELGVRTESLAVVAGVLAELGTRVSLNSDRSAVQVLSCDAGTVLAHVSVPRGWAGRLQAMAAATDGPQSHIQRGPGSWFGIATAARF